MKYLSPLAVYIIWHPAFTIGNDISESLFGALCRDVEHPLDQRLGIPTFFRSTIDKEGRSSNIPFDEAERTIIVCLIDDKMILDKSFKNYVVEIYASSCKYPKARFIPVALSNSAFNLDLDIGKLNYIRTEHAKGTSGKEVFDAIYHQLLHELCKIFVNAANLKKSLPPVKLFISHSKHDEEVVKEAIAFRDHVNTNMQLKTFFDVNDIGYGEDFTKTIEDNASNCVVVAFLSDSFSTREWCRNEIIISKKNHCPIVVVNALKKGERRSFPYLGNVPTIIWTGDVTKVVELALETTLRSFVVQQSLKMQAAFFGVQNDFILSNYPELFSIIGIKQTLVQENKKAGIVIYPDPPLGNEELRLLNEMDERLSFITPLQLSMFLPYE